MSNFDFDSLGDVSRGAPTIDELREAENLFRIKNKEQVDFRVPYQIQDQGISEALGLTIDELNDKLYEEFPLWKEVLASKKAGRITDKEYLQQRARYLDEYAKGKAPTITQVRESLKREAQKAEEKLTELNYYSDSALDNLSAGALAGFDQISRDDYEQFGLAASVAGSMAATALAPLLGAGVALTGLAGFALGYIGDISPVLLRRNKLAQYRESIGLPYGDEEFTNDLLEYSMASLAGTALGMGLGAAIRPVATVRSIGEVSANALKYAGDTRIGKKISSGLRSLELDQFGRNTDPAVLGNPKITEDGTGFTVKHAEALDTGIRKTQNGEKLTDADLPMTQEEFNVAASNAAKNAGDSTIDGSRAKDLARFVEEKTPEQVKAEQTAKINKARAGEAEAKAAEVKLVRDKETGDYNGVLSDGQGARIEVSGEGKDKTFSAFIGEENIGVFKKRKEAEAAINEINLAKQKEGFLPHGTEAPDVATVPQAVVPENLQKLADKFRAAQNKHADAAKYDAFGYIINRSELRGKAAAETRALRKFNKAAKEAGLTDEQSLQILRGEPVTAVAEAPTRTLSEYERGINPDLAPVTNEQAKEFIDKFAKSAEFDNYTETAIRNFAEVNPEAKIDLDGAEMSVKEAIEQLKNEQKSAIESSTTCGIGIIG